MNLALEAISPHGDKLTSSLFDWLKHEPVIARDISWELNPPTPGTLGTGQDVLIVAVGAGGAVAILAQALLAWVKQRTADFHLTIRTETREVTLEAQRIRLDSDALTGLFNQLDQLVREDDGTTARVNAAETEPA